ncbi:MAG: hypothetical protein ACXV2E_05990 [Halobacteriota archaeon]
MHAVSQILISLPTGRALPKKFFGGHIGIVVFMVRDWKDEFINFCAIVVHGAKWSSMWVIVR